MIKGTDIIMAVNRLCTAFRQVTIKNNIIGKQYTSQAFNEHNVTLSNIPKISFPTISPEGYIKFIPKSQDIPLENPVNITRTSINELPLVKRVPFIENPLIPKIIEPEQPSNKYIQLPCPENILEKLAVRMIVIRRKKMKKHKRRKLRKRMHFVWLKIRTRRNVLKEKLFQAEMVAKITQAHQFDAKKFVQEKLNILVKERLPKTYKGEILPPDVIRKFLQEEKEKKERKLNRPRLTLD